MLKIFKKKKFKFFDLGQNSNDKVDYPDYAHKLSKVIKKKK